LDALPPGSGTIYGRVYGWRPQAGQDMTAAGNSVLIADLRLAIMSHLLLAEERSHRLIDVKDAVVKILADVHSVGNRRGCAGFVHLAVHI
jgi:hypothetical protein